jgi:transcriptional regulator with XRE-family HTH domain
MFRHAHAAMTSTMEGPRLASAAQRAAFSQALQRARNDAGLSQGALARTLRVSRSAVSQWELALTAPRPDTTTKLERLLQLEPGSLGRLLGQVPADTAKPGSISVSEAIEADPRLGRRERDLLIAMYRQLIRQRETGAASG